MMEKYFHFEIHHINANRKFITELFQRKLPHIKSLHFNDDGNCSVYTTEKPGWFDEVCESYGITNVLTETAKERAARIEKVAEEENNDVLEGNEDRNDA